MTTRKQILREIYNCGEALFFNQEQVFKKRKAFVEKYFPEQDSPRIRSGDHIIITKYKSNDSSYENQMFEVLDIEDNIMFLKKVKKLFMDSDTIIINTDISKVKRIPAATVKKVLGE